MITVEQAKALCVEAHKGQFRRDNITPYHTHPFVVADVMETDEEKIVAYLHDVVEDTEWYLSTDIDNIPAIRTASKGFELPTAIYIALEAITRKPGVSYITYINNIKQDPLPTKVKIADMFHNISDNPSQKQREKYFSALKVLLKD